MSCFGKFLAAQTEQEKDKAIAELQNLYGFQYFPEFRNNIHKSKEWSDESAFADTPLFDSIQHSVNQEN